eukprot:4067383-Pleurochrysis_carterae.AAC.2
MITIDSRSSFVVSEKSCRNMEKLMYGQPISIDRVEKWLRAKDRTIVPLDRPLGVIWRLLALSPARKSRVRAWSARTITCFVPRALLPPHSTSPPTSKPAQQTASKRWLCMRSKCTRCRIGRTTHAATHASRISPTTPRCRPHCRPKLQPLNQNEPVTAAPRCSSRLYSAVDSAVGYSGPALTYNTTNNLISNLVYERFTGADRPHFLIDIAFCAQTSYFTHWPASR